jgi:hypothetical protein
VKILGSGILGPDLARKAVEELRTKCRIYAGGALKRGKKEEAEYYLGLASAYEERAVPAP